jgi:hypothetical protein
MSDGSLPAERYVRDLGEVELRELYESLRGPLDDLGIEIGRDVLDVWLDRQHHGRQAPIPARAVLQLQEWTRRVLEGK